jgi:ribonuclease HI
MPTVFEVNRRAQDTWQDWSKAQKKTKHDGCNITTEGNQRWSKPPAGILKCNVDAACYAEQNFYCIAACLRDDKGQFVAAFAKRFEGQPAIDEAEAIGVLETLQWLHNSHNAANLIETDSLHVAQVIGSNSKNNSEFVPVIKACRGLLNLNKNSKFTYIIVHLELKQLL